MSRGISRNEIPTATLQGMQKAAIRWKSLHGTWADQAAEYWFTVHVALQLQKQLDESRNWIGLETSIDETIRQSGLVRPGRRRGTLRDRGRCDIVVARANEKPFAAIEIKSPAYSFSSPLQSDIKRLRDLLCSNTRSSLSVTCLALYSSASEERSRYGAKAALNRRFDTNAERTNDLCGNSGLVVRDVRKIKKDDDDHWGVQCIYLMRC